MLPLTVVFCTYKRAARWEKRAAAWRAQIRPVRFDILAVNNNSPDNTVAVLTRLAAQPGAPLRFVTETAQGIVRARHRAIEEAMTSDIQFFIDGDALPQPGLLAAAHDAIVHEGAECVGGGEDGVMFERLLRTGTRMHYRPALFLCASRPAFPPGVHVVVDPSARRVASRHERKPCLRTDFGLSNPRHAGTLA